MKIIAIPTMMKAIKTGTPSKSKARVIAAARGFSALFFSNHVGSEIIGGGKFSAKFARYISTLTHFLAVSGVIWEREVLCEKDNFSG